MFTTSQSALASAVREETISRNLHVLAQDYAEKGKFERAQKLEMLSNRRAENMRDDFGDALHLEAKGR